MTTLPNLTTSRYGDSAAPSWRAVDWPAHERHAVVDGCRVNYVDIGAGDETVLFVHGFSGTWRWWLETLPAIARSRRAIAVDLPGCGASQMPLQPITIELWCRTLDTLCERLGLARVTVAGFSLGTVVAPQMAVRHAERIDRLVLAGGPVFSASRLLRHPLRTTRSQPRMTSVVVSELLSAPLPLPARLKHQLACRPGLRELAFAAYARHPRRLAPDVIANAVLPGLGAPGAIPSLRDALHHDVYAELEQIACPVLAVNGADDKLVPAADIDELERRLPHARSRVFADTGHWVQLERAAAFNAELESFLEDA